MSNGTHFKGPVDSKGGFTVDGETVVTSEGGVAEAALAANAVTTTKIKDGNVTAAKLATDAVETAKIKDGNVTLDKLSAEITPSHVVKFAGQHTTVGGDANETATVTGVLATDIVIATIEDNGTNNVTLLQAAAAANAVNFTLSANPGTDCIINYMVLRNTMLQ